MVILMKGKIILLLLNQKKLTPNFEKWRVRGTASLSFGLEWTKLAHLQSTAVFDGWVPAKLQ